MYGPRDSAAPCSWIYREMSRRYFTSNFFFSFHDRTTGTRSETKRREEKGEKERWENDTSIYLTGWLHCPTVSPFKNTTTLARHGHISPWNVNRAARQQLRLSRNLSISVPARVIRLLESLKLSKLRTSSILCNNKRYQLAFDRELITFTRYFYLKRASCLLIKLRREFYILFVLPHDE